MREFELNPAGFGVVTHLSGCLTWDIAQLATGQLDVERIVGPFDGAGVGSVTVDRAALHQVHTGEGWGAVLLPAPESGAVYFEGRRLVPGDPGVENDRGDQAVSGRPGLVGKEPERDAGRRGAGALGTDRGEGLLGGRVDRRDP